MKYFTLLGGFLGFVLAFWSSWNAGNAPGFALRDAMVGCLFGALLWRGLHAALMNSLRQHLLEQAVRVQPEAATTDKTAGKP